MILKQFMDFINVAIYQTIQICYLLLMFNNYYPRIYDWSIYTNGIFHYDYKTSEIIMSMRKVNQIYQLSSQIIITYDMLQPIAEFNRVHSISINLWISFQFHNTTNPIILKHISHRINSTYDDHQFNTISFNC
jgi:hypothetical protein